MSDHDWAYKQLTAGVQAVVDLNTKPLHVEIERLRARLAEAERDAARYRWVREHPLMSDEEWAEAERQGFRLLPPEKMDAAIDAAMGESRE